MTPTIGAAKPPKRVFFAAIVVVFFCTVSVADSIGFVPCYIDATPCEAAAAPVEAKTLTLSDLPQLGEDAPAADPVQAPVGVLPEHLEIDAIALDLPVQNPETRDLAVLDQLLTKGPARHPDSGKLGDGTNIIIFGHSSHLPIVHNKMFQAFNRVPELDSGDLITLKGEDGKSYLYSVVSVKKETTDSYNENFLAHPDNKLFIVTCDTLTGKSARYILEADFVGASAQ
ncbi:MAG: hypothetical protein RLZZ416_716 [Candidatus Parcubacteria bacterium]